MTFLPGPVTPLSAPLAPGEIFRPTRVVFRHPENRKVTARLFSTEARAFDFAADQEDVLVIQDAREAPPPQDATIFRSFTNFGQRRPAGKAKPATRARRLS